MPLITAGLRRSKGAGQLLHDRGRLSPDQPRQGRIDLGELAGAGGSIDAHRYLDCCWWKTAALQPRGLLLVGHDLSVDMPAGQARENCGDIGQIHGLRGGEWRRQPVVPPLVGEDAPQSTKLGEEPPDGGGYPSSRHHTIVSLRSAGGWPAASGQSQ